VYEYPVRLRIDCVEIPIVFGSDECFLKMNSGIVSSIPPSTCCVDVGVLVSVVVGGGGLVMDGSKM